MQSPAAHSRVDGRTGDHPEPRVGEGGGFVLKLTRKKPLDISQFAHVSRLRCPTGPSKNTPLFWPGCCPPSYYLCPPLPPTRLTGGSPKVIYLEVGPLRGNWVMRVEPMVG